MAYDEADDTATLVNRSGKQVRNFSYEEIRRLIGKSGTSRELNNFEQTFSCPLLASDFHADGYFYYFMLGNQRLLGIAHKRL